MKIVGVSAAAAGLVACGGSGSSTAAASSTAGTSSDGPEKVTLKVWAPAEDQADDSCWLPIMTKAFQEANADRWDITFQLEVCSEGDAATKIVTDPAAAGDVYLFANDQIGTLDQAQAISKLGGSTVEQVQNDNSETMVASVTYKEGIYGVPFTGNTWFMYYNKDIFSEDDVKNLDTMLSKGKVAFPIQNSWYVEAFFLATGCQLYGGVQDADQGVEFGGENGVKAATYMVNLIANPNFVNDVDNKYGLAGLNDGTIGAYFSGSWDAGNLTLGDKLGACQLPTITIDGKDYQMKGFAGSKAIGVNPNCKTPAAAVALAAYLGSSESQKLHYELRGIIPTCNDLADLIADDIVAKAQNDTIANTAIVQPFIPEMGTYWTPAETFGKAVANGEVTLDNVEEKVEAFNESFKATL
jgi:arabinogalactan oligomer/maltooligosaccharide transport system substrate-binding protein